MRLSFSPLVSSQELEHAFPTYYSFIRNDSPSDDNDCLARKRSTISPNDKGKVTACYERAMNRLSSSEPQTKNFRSKDQRAIVSNSPLSDDGVRRLKLEENISKNYSGRSSPCIFM